MDVQGSASQLLSVVPEPRRRLLLITLTVLLVPMACLLVVNALQAYLGVFSPNMFFLCGVILAAIWFGRTAALFTAASSFLVYNYNLSDPRFQLGLAGVNDILTLIVFVTVALLIGGLAGNVHDERNRAREQVRMLSELFAASQTMAGSNNARDAMRLLVDAAHRLHGNPVTAFERSETGPVRIHSAPANAVLPQTVQDEVNHVLASAAGGPPGLPDGWRVQGVPLGDLQAVLVWQESRGAQQTIAAELLIKLAQAAIERAQAAGRQLAVDTMAATDRLRTALLSSISHDFRTPLATITASASSLLEYGEKFSNATRTDLLTSIQEEAERLSRFVGNVLDMTRLEAGALKPRSEWTDPLDVIERARDRLSERLSGRQLVVNAPAALPSIKVDPVLLEQALINILDNAIVHTPSHSIIEVGASHDGRSLRLWVEDDGAGVAPADLETIFDKFQRSSTSGETAGLGLGLAISKGLVEAMSGSVSASSPGGEGRGLRIEFVFPSQIEAEPA